MVDTPRSSDPLGVKTWWYFLTSEQKFSLVIFSVFGFFSLGFSTWYLYSHIRSPFLVRRSLLEESRTALSAKDDAPASDQTLKTKDTDHDGLSDYDELNVYHTSPYLADSDSDGISDGVEIAAGADPNCPQGKNCQTPAEGIPAVSASTSAQELLTNARVPQAPNILGGASSSLGGVQGFLQNPPEPASLSPAEIKTYLVSHNLVTAPQLEGLSDDALRQLYQNAYDEARRGQQAAAGSSALTAASSTP